MSGYTSSEDFPVTEDAYQGSMRSTMDLFLVKIDPRRPLLDALLYGTFIGGDSLDVAKAMTVGPDGRVWIAGYTLSSDFPVTPDAYQSTNAGGADVFLLQFDYSKRNSPEAISYSTYLGGRFDDIPYGLALDQQGRVAVTGYTYSDDFPIAASAPPAPKATINADVFLALIDPSKTDAEADAYSTVWGGAYTDVAFGVAVDSGGNLLITGATLSVDLPVTDGSTKLAPGGRTQSFVMKSAPGI